MYTTLQPLDQISISSVIASLPKADLHLHQEEIARLERIIANRKGRQPHDWQASAQRLLTETMPGRNRLMGLYAPDATFDFGGVIGDEDEYIIAKIVDVLDEAVADGAILTEIRFGTGGLALFQSDFMALFREAERRVQARSPQLFAEAIGYLRVVNDLEKLQIAEKQFEHCLQMAKEGLAGIDFITEPYDTEADPALWKVINHWAERAADVGLGITIHSGEFSVANLAAAVRVPALSRLGHAVYAVTDVQLMEQIAQRNITVECSLSSNVILGAVSSYLEHPIRKFAAFGIPVTLNTDDPVRIWTTIGREYAIAAELGFGLLELLGFTRNAIKASFTSSGRRRELGEAINQWEKHDGPII